MPACATSSLVDSIAKPLGASNAEDTRYANVLDTLMRSSALLRSVGEEKLAECMDTQATRNIREARRAGSDVGKILRGVTKERKRKMAEASAEDRAR